MSKTRTLLLGTASLMVSVAAADIVSTGTAFGATATYSSTFGPAATDWKGVLQTVTLPYFNSSVGTLTSVSLTLNESVNAQATFTAGPSGAQFAASEGLTTGIATAGACGGTAGCNGVAAIPGPDRLLTLNNVVFQIGSATSLSYVSFSANQVVHYSQVSPDSKTVHPVNTAQFVGTGSMTLPLVTSVFSLTALNGGNGTITETTVTSATVSIVYTYSSNQQDVPEPASIAALGTGLVGLAGVANRRRLKTRDADPAKRPWASVQRVREWLRRRH